MPTADSPINSTTSSPDQVNKFALVVGVNNSSAISSYRATLRYAERDAEDMAYLLKQHECDFTLVAPTLIGEKATSWNIKQGVMDLVKRRTAQDFLLFYFAGHALKVSNNIYFVTHDFQEDNVEVDPHLYLSMRWLWKVLYQSIGAGRVLIILDCCYAGNMVDTRDDPLKIDLRELLEEWDTGSNGKDQKNCLRLILTATGYDLQAQELEEHGLMTGLLLRALQGEEDVLDKEGYIDIKSLHAYLHKKMPKEQLPDLSGKFGPFNCILASYPQLSELHHQQAKENELKSSVEKGILAELYRLHAETQHTQPFDHLICHNTSFADLDLDAITEFLKQERTQQENSSHLGASIEEQLIQFGFLDNSYPTYGVLLCFGQNPSKWVSGATTRCVDWGSSPNQDRLQDSQQYRGPLLKQFELSRDFLRKHLRLHRVINRQGSSEEWEIPFRVLDEALANALVHREYANRTDTVCVEVFDDRIEISSPGTLPFPMTEELLLVKHKSYPRNPQIAGIFYLHGYIEKFGTGIQRMQRFMKEEGLQAPKFKLSEDKTLTVVLYRPNELLSNSKQQLKEIVSSAYLPAYDNVDKEVQLESRRSFKNLLASIINRQEIVCPFCFSEFGSQELRFRCVNSVCPGKVPDAIYANARGLMPFLMGRVLFPSQQPSLFRKPRSKECDICRKVSRTYLCPNCHYELPTDIGEVDQRMIAIIGGINTGKSCFIAVLIQRLREIGLQFGFTVTAVGEDTRERYVRDFYEPLFERGMVIRPTFPAAVDSRVEAPLIFRLTFTKDKSRRVLNLNFFDTAGEDMASLNTLSIHNRYIAHANGIIFLIDPLQIEAVREQLLDVHLPYKDPRAHPYYILDRVRELLEAYYGVSARKFKVPIAFTLSKLDTIWSLLDPGAELRRPSKHDGVLDLSNVQSVSTEVEHYLDYWINPDFCSKMRADFQNSQYFGISSLGRQPDANARIEAVTPFRVEDPFLWILYKLDLIKGKKTL